VTCDDSVGEFSRRGEAEGNMSVHMPRQFIVLRNALKAL
jgi:hypothetical protein